MTWYDDSDALCGKASNFLSRMNHSYADVLASWRWKCGSVDETPLLAVGGPLGLTGVKGHFTKAAKTYSDIGFILIFHVPT